MACAARRPPPGLGDGLPARRPRVAGLQPAAELAGATASRLGAVEALEAAEGDLAETSIRRHRHAGRAADHRRGLPGPAEVAAHDGERAGAGQRLGHGGRLRTPEGVETRVALALEATLAVPRRAAMAHHHQLGCHHIIRGSR